MKKHTFNTYFILFSKPLPLISNDISCDHTDPYVLSGKVVIPLFVREMSIRPGIFENMSSGIFEKALFMKQKKTKCNFCFS